MACPPVQRNDTTIHFQISDRQMREVKTYLFFVVDQIYLMEVGGDAGFAWDEPFKTSF